jgi:hypothetical protein
MWPHVGLSRCYDIRDLGMGRLSWWVLTVTRRVLAEKFDYRREGGDGVMWPYAKRHQQVEAARTVFLLEPPEETGLLAP